MTNIDIVKIAIVILELIFLTLEIIFYKNNKSEKALLMSLLMNLLVIILYMICLAL